MFMSLLNTMTSLWNRPSVRPHHSSAVLSAPHPVGKIAATIATALNPARVPVRKRTKQGTSPGNRPRPASGQSPTPARRKRKIRHDVVRMTFCGFCEAPLQIGSPCTRCRSLSHGLFPGKKLWLRIKSFGTALAHRRASARRGERMDCPRCYGSLKAGARQCRRCRWKAVSETPIHLPRRRFLSILCRKAQTDEQAFCPNCTASLARRATRCKHCHWTLRPSLLRRLTLPRLRPATKVPLCVHCAWPVRSRTSLSFRCLCGQRTRSRAIDCTACGSPLGAGKIACSYCGEERPRREARREYALAACRQVGQDLKRVWAALLPRRSSRPGCMHCGAQDKMRAGVCWECEEPTPRRLSLFEPLKRWQQARRIARTSLEACTRECPDCNTSLLRRARLCLVCGWRRGGAKRPKGRFQWNPLRVRMSSCPNCSAAFPTFRRRCDQCHWVHSPVEYWRHTSKLLPTALTLTVAGLMWLLVWLMVTFL